LGITKKGRGGLANSLRKAHGASRAPRDTKTERLRKGEKGTRREANEVAPGIGRVAIPRSGRSKARLIWGGGTLEGTGTFQKRVA